MFGTGPVGAGVADKATAFWEVGVRKREKGGGGVSSFTRVFVWGRSGRRAAQNQSVINGNLEPMRGVCAVCVCACD